MPSTLFCCSLKDFSLSELKILLGVKTIPVVLKTASGDEDWLPGYPPHEKQDFTPQSSSISWNDSYQQLCYTKNWSSIFRQLHRVRSSWPTQTSLNAALRIICQKTSRPCFWESLISHKTHSKKLCFGEPFVRKLLLTNSVLAFPKLSGRCFSPISFKSIWNIGKVYKISAFIYCIRSLSIIIYVYLFIHLFT